MLIYQKPEFDYSELEWEEAIENPVIVHFTTSFLSIRPWFEGSRHPYAGYWEKIRNSTLRGDMPLQKLPKQKSRDTSKWLYRKIPGNLKIYAVGFLHVYLKLIIYRIR